MSTFRFLSSVTIKMYYKYPASVVISLFLFNMIIAWILITVFVYVLFNFLILIIAFGIVFVAFVITKKQLKIKRKPHVIVYFPNK